MLRNTLVLLLLFTVLSGSSYEQWLQSESNQYLEYKKNIDDEFSDMLKKDWEIFQSMKISSPYKKAKPIFIPEIKQKVKIPIDEIKKSPIVIIKPQKNVVLPKSQKIIKVTHELKNYHTANFEFFSIPITIQYDKKTFFNINGVKKDSISKFWDMMNSSNYTILIKQIQSYNDNINLNDWAKYQLIHKLGLNIFNKDNNKANLFTWFMLIKMEFDVKVGYSTNNIYLLSTIQHNIYQVSFFTIKNKKYYILTSNGKAQDIESIYTYNEDYPNTKKTLSFVILEEMKLYTNLKTKLLKFNYNGKIHTITTQYSSDLIDFYKTFPQSDYNIYFSTKNSTVLSDSILVNIASLINGKSEIEAVNLLLRFVQTAFQYKTDKKQFDYEKVMFPEETIHYSYSDCEDRSIMFSYLVKSLLNLDVVGVKYNNHLATAVAFSSKISGVNFRYKETLYTISDPTYINSNAGMIMPQYINSKFKIISLR